jgi:hypothetical protein
MKRIILYSIIAAIVFSLFLLINAIGTVSWARSLTGIAVAGLGVAMTVLLEKLLGQYIDLLSKKRSETQNLVASLASEVRVYQKSVDSQVQKIERLETAFDYANLDSIMEAVRYVYGFRDDIKNNIVPLPEDIYLQWEERGKKLDMLIDLLASRKKD